MKGVLRKMKCPKCSSELKERDYSNEPTEPNIVLSCNCGYSRDEWGEFSSQKK